ncbi:hypothetical protein M407DRAFT_217209 [Tulasnella calospora MUT 4182]|uniref:DUF1264-domain-containing protein n=1 Tax=Tulasnella calospora MUT 4182 TaxID=1051891 RepID=A0A0C3QIM0_9AGAM|nr:hypothetical protein M407DRAFT_217209 [Tulasnella calospora MUT 4182]
MTTDMIPEFNRASGEPLTTKNFILDTGAAATPDFRPVKPNCAHLNAFHACAHESTRCVEANHFCSHLNEDVRQCILYDSPEPNARLIGIEYMISPTEHKLWHSHVYEINSGTFVMPKPTTMPEALWQKAETAEMEDVITLYGKVYHLWRFDRGDKLPLGQPQLMTSSTFERAVSERDAKFSTDHKQKQKEREYIQESEVHPSQTEQPYAESLHMSLPIRVDADQAWREGL